MENTLELDNLLEEVMSAMHTHSEFSNLRFLDVCHKVEQLIDRAVELNCPCMALTDHESLSGAIRALRYVKEQKEKCAIPQDFTLAIGDEIYLVDSMEEDEEGRLRSTSDYYHFILIAKDKIGFNQLKELSSIAWSHSYYTGKMERVPTTKEDLKRVISKNKGHVMASTACLGSELGKTIISIMTSTDEEYNQEQLKKLDDYLSFCIDLFGEDFRLEMQPGISDEQKYVNKAIVSLSEQYNVPYIITTDVHYLSKDLRELHAAYLNSREDGQRELSDFYESTYMMDCEEIHERMDDYLTSEVVSKAIKNTNEWASVVTEYDTYHDQVVPKATIPDFVPTYSFASSYSFCPYIEKFAKSDDINDQYFLYLVEQGWWDKEFKDTLTKEDIKKMMLRINDEMQAIWETSVKIHDKVSSYYLTALEIVNMMWDDSEDGGDSFVGVSRGSIACFYTAYLINLQQINPLRYNIPYWRHLHESRPEMPDVDIDSEAGKRGRIINATKKKYGADHVLNIGSFKTEGSKSAILTCARGRGIDNDVAQYLASLIPTVRGSVTPLNVMLNGNEEEGIKPNTEFINECNKYDGLLEMAMALEGLICGRTIHASGVIIFEQPYTELNCMMRAPNGQEITQWNMDDSTYCGGLKFDYLTIKNLDSMHLCMNFLIEYGLIEWKGSLRDTYNAYFHPDILDYSSEDMWKLAEHGDIVNLFQFQTLVGGQAIKKIKPRSLIELGVANSVMRLMKEEGKEEAPLDKYVRYKNDMSQWYECMRDEYNLTEDEIHTVEKYLKDVSGMATMQEEVMKLVMDDHISNFDMVGANKLRKSIAKKKKKLQREAKEKFYKLGRENGASENLLNYVWNECVVPQLGYSFSLPHVLGYSTIAVQEMNEAFLYPIIYWNTANLIVDSGSIEDVEDNKSTQYGKVATAIADMQKRGVTISLPLINEAKFGFVPDEKNNRIIYSLRSLCGIGDDVARAIVENQPYNSLEDFCTKLVDTKLVTNGKMIILIKAGCFTEIDNEDRKLTMKKFIKRSMYEPNENLTFQNFKRVQELGIIPKELNNLVRIRNFKDYILHESFLYKTVVNEGKKVPKCGYHDRLFKTDETSTPFLLENFTDDCIEKTVGEFCIISEKKFLKEWKKKQEPLSEWLSKPETVDLFNETSLNKLLEQKASGTIPKWEMDSLCFYYTEHALKNLKEKLYGVVNFFDLPEQPEPYDHYYRYINGEKKAVDKYQIVRLAGTVLDNDNNKHMITLLTNYGVVTCKYNKGQYSYYNRRITATNEENGKKKVLDNSWLSRGMNVMVCGYRQDDIFRVYKYSDTVYSHTTYRIDSINEVGEVEVTTERVQV